MMDQMVDQGCPLVTLKVEHIDLSKFLLCKSGVTSSLVPRMGILCS